LILAAVSNRFTRQHRLRTAAEFKRVFDKARRSRDQYFTVLCRDNESELARLGLAISKKHCRRATARNRIKRIVRESFRNRHDLSRLDIVVINRPAACDAASGDLHASLARHWQRCATRRPGN